jgi:SAM-dependent methyltransferase
MTKGTTEDVWLSLSAGLPEAALNPHLASILACPECLGRLIVRERDLLCAVCGEWWPRGLRGIPVFHREQLHQQAVGGENLQAPIAGLMRRLNRLATPPTLGLDLVSGECMERLGKELRRMDSQRPILDVGSGARLSETLRRLGPDVLGRTVHFDVSDRFQLVDLVADAGRGWPVADASVDAVVASAIMCYLSDPRRFAAEAHRVLAAGGWLFVTVPMLQPQMEEFDCCRWTVDGLRRLFDGFDVIESGATAGPATVLGRTLMEFLAVVTSIPNRRLYGLARSVWGWVFWPIKYLDLLLMRHPRSHVLASAVFLLARKAT